MSELIYTTNSGSYKEKSDFFGAIKIFSIQIFWRGFMNMWEKLEYEMHVYDWFTQYKNYLLIVYIKPLKCPEK